jgi:murein DD-endopeptidase MepM/ murein hydrolase activator NlpD
LKSERSYADVIFQLLPSEENEDRHRRRKVFLRLRVLDRLGILSVLGRTRSLLVAAFGAASLASDAAAQSSLTVAPTILSPGSLVRFRVDGTAAQITGVGGELAGEPLHFTESEPGRWRAIGAFPVGARDTVAARVLVQLSSGGTDTLTRSLTLPRRRVTRGAPRRLSVSPRFTQPLDSATEARIARENARARDVGRASHETPPLWSARFVKPRPSTITSRFGSGRMFNRRVASSHLGVDFRGATGAPVYAANRGVVALVDNFFLAGNVVYIDHGGGLVTGYFHLSKTLVSAGDTISRGQLIGRVGATGRVTAPHLHWSARYGAITINPLDVISLNSDWYGRSRSTRE